MNASATGSATAGLRIQTIHHVSLTVTDLDASTRFYKDVLGLRQIERPPFDFPGAWFELGDRQLHLIVHTDPTFRDGKAVDSRDVHFAVRVPSYGDAMDLLRSRGYREDAEDALLKIKVSPRATAGFPQIYLLDPDRHVIEINAETLDRDA